MSAAALVTVSPVVVAVQPVVLPASKLWAKIGSGAVVAAGAAKAGRGVEREGEIRKVVKNRQAIVRRKLHNLMRWLLMRNEDECNIAH